MKDKIDTKYLSNLIKHTHTYIYACVCVCVCVLNLPEWERKKYLLTLEY